ncbi:hypothetical protein [Trichothermofontia sp.]
MPRCVGHSSSLLATHLMKEEQILLLMIRQLATSGTVANPMHRLAFEHIVGLTTLAVLFVVLGAGSPGWPELSHCPARDCIADASRPFHAEPPKINHPVWFFTRVNAGGDPG